MQVDEEKECEIAALKVFFTQFDTARRWQKSKYGRGRGGKRSYGRGGKRGNNGRDGTTINYITFKTYVFS